MTISVATPFLEDKEIKSVSQNQQADAERMHDVLLLLENLALREESTTKLILGCLYDIGSQVLIDQKILYRPANRFMGWVAHNTKPVALMIGLRWFKRNARYLSKCYLVVR